MGGPGGPSKTAFLLPSIFLLSFQFLFFSIRSEDLLGPLGPPLANPVKTRVRPQTRAWLDSAFDCPISDSWQPLVGRYRPQD